MLVILVVALAPLAAAATLHGIIQLRKEREAWRADLLAGATRSAAAEARIIAEAAGALRYLIRDLDARGRGTESCNRSLEAAVGDFPSLRQVAVIDANGVVVCASDPAMVGERLEAGIRPVAGEQLSISAPAWRPPRGMPDIGVHLSAPLGERARGITATVRLSGLLSSAADGEHRHARTNALLDEAGRVVSAGRPLDWTRLDPSRPFGEVTDTGGRRWTYAVAPIPVVGAPAPFHIAQLAPTPGMVQLAPSIVWLFLLPISALALASVAIWWSANRAILRWVARLGDLARGFAREQYRIEDELFATAPQEIAALAADLEAMGEAVAERDRKLQDAVARQRLLALELHHRVRNNLQIVGSYLALKSETAMRDGGRRAIDAARLRVSALALVHRLLYDAGELTTVSTDSLLGELCELVNSHQATRRRIALDCDIESLPVAIDSAVPLALWTIELVSTLVERWGESASKLRLRLRLVASGGEAHLEVAGDDVGPPRDAEAESRALMLQIARQLGGQLDLAGFDLESPRVVLRIPVERLARA